MGSSLAEAAQPTQGEGPWSAKDYRNGSDIEDDLAGEARAFETLRAKGASEEFSRKLAPLYRELAADPQAQELLAMGSRAAGGRSDRPQDDFAARIYDKVLDQRTKLVGLQLAQKDAYETSLLAPIIQHVNALDAYIGAQGVGMVSDAVLSSRQVMAAALVSKDVYFDESISELLPSSMARQAVRDNNGAQGSGFFGATYSDSLTGKTFVAARGTEFGVPGRGGADLATNLIQLLGGKAAQYSEAIDWARELRKEFGASNLVSTGHWLGGGLASAMANVVPGSQGITFNAAGLHVNALPSGFTPSSNANIQAYYVKGELISALQDNSDWAQLALKAIPSTRSLGDLLSVLQAGPAAAGQRIVLDAVSAPDRVTSWTSFGGRGPAVTYSASAPFAGGPGDMMKLHGQNQVLFSLSRNYQQQSANFYLPEALGWLLKH